MRYMGWSWEDLKETPEYVRQYSWDFMQARLNAEHRAHDHAARDVQHA